VQSEPTLVACIDDFRRRRGHRREDSQPGVRVIALVVASTRDVLAADPMESVGTDYKVTFQPCSTTVVEKGHIWASSAKVVKSDVLDAEAYVPPAVQSGCDEIFHDLLLSVDGDAAAYQLFQIETMGVPVEAHLQPVMANAFGVKPFRYPRLPQCLNGAVLKNSGPNAVLHVIAVATFHHNRLDSLQIEEVG